MRLGDFVIYCGRVFLATTKRVDGSIDIEDMTGATSINLVKKDVEDLIKADCWYKKR